MIEIIKNGTKKQLTCKQCGCLFSYEAEDIQTKDYGHNFDNLHTQQYIICPQCKNNIILKGTR